MMWNENLGFWGWSGWLAMGGMMLLGTAVTIGIVVLIVDWVGRSAAQPRSFETPRAALDRRLALGEISEDDYARARRMIEDRPVAKA